jgi:undecaprenyl-phosphate 4-deoxy-4-formamido-L-arabinose transferase
MALFGLGLIGEYIVRINEQVKGRPRYLVAAVLEKRA